MSRDLKDDILWAWQHGTKADEIAAELGTTRSVVLGIVHRARQAGDVRATRRRPPAEIARMIARTRAELARLEALANLGRAA